MAKAIVAFSFLLCACGAQNLENQLPEDTSDPSTRWVAYLDDAPPVPQPTKVPHPVLTADQSWEGLGLVSANSVPLEVDGKIRLYYRYYGDHIHDRHIAAAESYDGFNFSKIGPVLKGVPSFSVIHDDEYLGAGRHTIGTSHDGMDWDTRDWPVSYPSNDTRTSLVKFQGKYIAFVRSWVQRDGIKIRQVAVTTSRDFETWTPKRVLVNPADPDVQPYGLSVTEYDGKLIGLLWWFHITPGTVDCGHVDAELIWSEDGDEWQRTHRPIIEPGLPFDRGATYPAPIFIKGGMAYIYYTAVAVDHCAEKPPGSISVGLATIPTTTLEALWTPPF